MPLNSNNITFTTYVYRQEKLQAQTWQKCWDHFSLDPGWTGALDVASLVDPVQPVSVPVQTKRQDAVAGGKQLSFGGFFASQLQQVDVGNCSIYKSWVYGVKKNKRTRRTDYIQLQLDIYIHTLWT